MSDAIVPIRYADSDQERKDLQGIAADIAKILTNNEEILYIALQNVTAITPRKDCVVATSNRFLVYRPDVLGRVNFSDFLWQDIKEIHIDQGILSTALSLETIAGQKEHIGNLDKDQAKRLYAVCQQMDQEWREKRRIREMEEARARSGGVYMNTPAPDTSAPAEDPVAKLAKAKAMLDQRLISEIEYQALKAKILASM